MIGLGGEPSDGFLLQPKQVSYTWLAASKKCKQSNSYYITVFDKGGVTDRE